mgnify:CR=1 FL=1
MQCVAPWKGKIKLMDSFEDAWKVISDYCKSKITDIAYNTWISRIQPVDLDFDNGTAYLLVPNDFHAQTLRRCYMSLLNEGFEEIFGTKFNIEFRTPANAPKKSKPSAAASITTSAATAPLLQSPDSSSYEYTFDTFIVGSSNKFAHAACLAVATNPSHAYNPLFLYGNSGLGKTHLLYAIGNEIKKNDPSKVICYIKGDDFTVELVESLRLAKMNEFRQKYRQADILLVDDVQFIGGKESTQEEFFHTFNALYDARKQIVLTSDRPPKEIKTLEDRLRSRFEQDLIADIQPPDLETRIAIIKRKAELDGVEISDEVCEYVASKIKANIRQLEGTVKKIKAKYYLDGEKPTINSVQGIISDILNNDAPPEVTVERIIDEVARTYGVSADEIRSQKNRSANISNARHIAIYVTRELTTLSMVAIGEEFGNHYWESEDNTVMNNGIPVDIIYREVDRFGRYIDTVIKGGKAFNGYTTAFWHNIKNSKVLFDKTGTFTKFRNMAQIDFPENLRSAIIKNNRNLLNGKLPSYDRQIKKAQERGDIVSVNHRITAFLESYFDVIFALNRQTHPGEKRQVQLCKKYCTLLPKDFEENINALMKSISDGGSYEIVTAMVNNLDEILNDEFK